MYVCHKYIYIFYAHIHSKQKKCLSFKYISLDPLVKDICLKLSKSGSSNNSKTNRVCTMSFSGLYLPPLQLNWYPFKDIYFQWPKFSSTKLIQRPLAFYYINSTISNNASSMHKYFQTFHTLRDSYMLYHIFSMIALVTATMR